MADYSQMSQTEFDTILSDLLRGLTGEQLVAEVPGIASDVMDAFNNDVLDKWAEIAKAA